MPRDCCSTGATFADAAAEYLRYVEHDRGVKPSTLRDYRSVIEAHLLPAFGVVRFEEIRREDIDRWRATLSGISNRTKNKLLVVMHGVFRRAQTVYGLPANPVAQVERHPQRTSGDIEVFSPEEVLALVRAAAGEQDAAIYMTAAFTGLRRGELLALRWRDVDFTGSVIRVRASYAGGRLTTPKSGKVRSVPLAPDVAQALANRQGRHPPRAGVDGPRRRPDDDEVPALRAACGMTRRWSPMPSLQPHPTSRSVADPPPSFQRVERLVDVANIAHVAIFDFHRRLVELDGVDIRTRELLAEAAQIASVDVPRLYRPFADRLGRWIEVDLLSAPQAHATRAHLDRAATAILPTLKRLRARQDEIAAELRSRLAAD